MKKSDNKIGLCAFCETEQKLCESHITPKWLVKDRDTGTGFFQVAQNDPFKKRMPEGWKETLLCRSCEDIMEIYDDYSAVFFRASDKWVLERPFNEKVWVVHDYDYKKLKLFFMSILWRASVAKTQPFAAVSLETKELRRLRLMIEQGNPGKAFDFTVIISKRGPMKNGLEKISEQPKRFIKQDITHYIFDLNEYQVEIKASSASVTGNEEFWLKEAAPLFIYEGGVVAGRFNRILKTVQEQPKLLEEFRAQHAEKKQKKIE